MTIVYITNIVPNSRIAIYDTKKEKELCNEIVKSESFCKELPIEDNTEICVRINHVAYHFYELKEVITESFFHFFHVAEQTIDNEALDFAFRNNPEASQKYIEELNTWIMKETS